MTNLLVGLTIVRLLTNCSPTAFSSDGKGLVIMEQRCVVSAEVAVSHQGVTLPLGILPLTTNTETRKQSDPPLPPPMPPLPLRTKPTRKASVAQASVNPGSPLTNPGLLLSAASVIDPDCQCPFFRVSFLAQTNHIYSFQRSHDLVTWELRPPEIDGEEGVMGFFDVFDTGAMYRIASREGVLPP
jgi:hypothetical protein